MVIDDQLMSWRTSPVALRSSCICRRGGNESGRRRRRGEVEHDEVARDTYVSPFVDRDLVVDR